MIAIDTNVLLRAYLLDDKAASKLAIEVLKKANRSGIFVPSYAILEFAWVLERKKYPREKIADAIMTLINSEGISVGQSSIMEAAVQSYRTGKAGFGDHIIAMESLANNAKSLVTFDTDLTKDLPFCLLPERLSKV